MDKREYIAKLAEFLYTHGMTMSFSELAAHLNRNGLETGYGSGYEGGRGTSRLVSSVYSWAEKEGKHNLDAIARAFVNEKGEYPYEKVG